MNKEELRWCIRIKRCKDCPKKDECLNQKIVKDEIKKKFIHIEVGDILGSRTNKTSTNKD